MLKRNVSAESSNLSPAPPTPCTRRDFLKRSMLAAGAVAVPTLVPGTALGLNGAVPASERIILGGIGVGSRGTGVLNWMLPEKDVQFVAICDAKKSQREAIKRMVDNKYGTTDVKCTGTCASSWPRG